MSIENFPIEHREAAEFLSSIRPFDALSEEQLLFCVKNLTSTYHNASTKHKNDEPMIDYENPSLFVVRAGIFDVRDKDGNLIDRVSEGGFFGFVSLLTGKDMQHRIHVVESGLLFRIDKKTFKEARNQSSEFDHFFSQAFEQRLRVGLRRRAENSALATPIAEVMSKQLFSVSPDASIQSACKIMTDHNVASLLVMDDDSQLLGIFTDKDCRSRVVAKGTDITTQIRHVMTPNPISIEQTAMVHEATVMMIRHQIKHLPVTHIDKPVSMVTLSDLIRLQRSDPVLIIHDIQRAGTVAELVEISRSIPELLLQLIRQDVRADDLGRILTSVTGSLTRHLIHLAQRKLGPEPVPFVWLAFGSQGRQDQSAKSDQDNGLLLDNAVSEEDDAYFEQLATIVNDGLDACGYVYCPGEIMARNSKWRQPLRVWRNTFENWIQERNEKDLMHSNIFFDMRAIYTSSGAEILLNSLQIPILEMAKSNRIFLALMTSNALKLSPPLGFLNQFVVESSGEEKNTFDVKKRGVMPITEIVRIHALAHGVRAVNTNERLQILIDEKHIAAQDGQNLLDALEFISHQRLLHQGEQLKQSMSPDNFLNPGDLSPLVRRQLKDAFKVVHNAQRGLKQTYQGGLM